MSEEYKMKIYGTSGTLELDRNSREYQDIVYDVPFEVKYQEKGIRTLPLTVAEYLTNRFPVKLIKSHEDAKLPFRASTGAACSDLYSVETTEIQPGETKLISTGLKVAHIPTGHRLSIFDRSGFRAKGIFGSSVGIIDEDYRGELKVILYNSTKNPIQIKSGDRIAQMCLEIVQPVSYEFVDTFEETERGEGGFGSTN